MIVMKTKYLTVIYLVLFSILGFNTNTCNASGIVPGDEFATIIFSGQDYGVYFLITDPNGRRIGYDSINKQRIKEFDSAFGYSLDIRSGESDLFSGDAVLNLIPGEYQIEVIGAALTDYSVIVSIYRKPKNMDTTGFDFKTLSITPEHIAAIKSGSYNASYEGVIDKDLTSKYQFTYTSDPTMPPATAEKVLEPAGLKQDIELCRKLGWIDNDGVANSLIRKAEAIEAAMARGNNQAARNQINAFMSEIEAQSDKHISAKSYSNAVKLLLDDAQLLLNKLQ